MLPVNAMQMSVKTVDIRVNEGNIVQATYLGKLTRLLEVTSITGHTLVSRSC